ncbi:MAG: HAD-IIA family hydrolase [Chloroflexi bacterium]|uniref:HAD-IIA family hydrolase n=1 Tax=Candidatus Flexifilum breve TaxID=3140694 RepID=UPI0031357029|nr:HAD-IIA family hydrolase [Chloroflexota bacterium]
MTEIHGVVMDMDGVVWRGDELLPGAIALFDKLKARGLPFAAATNNSAKSPTDYVQKLAHMGIDGIREDQILTSGRVTISYLTRTYPQGTPVYVVGGDGLRHMVVRAGFDLSDAARVVVVGIDFDLTYNKLKRAVQLIRGGADFIGTNGDKTFPMADGLVPGAGSIIAAIQTGAGQAPLMMGKPNRPMFDAALELLGTSAANTLMIGDRMDTDIDGANSAGLQTALVLTGVTTRAELEVSPTQPDYVFDGLPQLLDALL